MLYTRREQGFSIEGRHSERKLLQKENPNYIAVPWPCSKTAGGNRVVGRKFPVTVANTHLTGTQHGIF